MSKRKESYPTKNGTRLAYQQKRTKDILKIVEDSMKYWSEEYERIKESREASEKKAPPGVDGAKT